MIEEITLVPVPTVDLILPDTDPLLRTISAPVTLFDDELRAFANRMAEAMLIRRGLGLAAVQIGRPVRLILVREGPERLIFMANPTVSRLLKREVIAREGCLSVPPHKWRPLARPAKCDARWQDLDGNWQEEGFSGMAARAVLHEVEHLDGILITDKEPAA